VIALRKSTRETLRHERATVLQELGARADADPRPFWRANQERAAELRRWAQRGGGRDAQQELGLVTSRAGAGDTDQRRAEACKYCGIIGGHTADCPVIS
jgi:hypothetical protein